MTTNGLLVTADNLIDHSQIQWETICYPYFMAFSKKTPLFSLPPNINRGDLDEGTEWHPRWTAKALMSLAAVRHSTHPYLIKMWTSTENKYPLDTRKTKRFNIIPTLLPLWDLNNTPLTTIEDKERSLSIDYKPLLAYGTVTISDRPLSSSPRRGRPQEREDKHSKKRMASSSPKKNYAHENEGEGEGDEQSTDNSLTYAYNPDVMTVPLDSLVHTNMYEYILLVTVKLESVAKVFFDRYYANNVTNMPFALLFKTTFKNMEIKELLLSTPTLMTNDMVGVGTLLQEGANHFRKALKTYKVIYIHDTEDGGATGGAIGGGDDDDDDNDGDDDEIFEIIHDSDDDTEGAGASTSGEANKKPRLYSNK